MIRALLLITAVFAVSALAMAGLLTYYAKVTGSVEVNQGVVLEIYGTNGKVLARAEYNKNVNLLADVIAGSNLTTFKYNNDEVVWYLNISYLADGSVPAPLKIKTKLENNFTGLFDEVVKFGLIFLNPSNLQEVSRVEINSTGVYLYYQNNLLASENWNGNNRITVTITTPIVVNFIVEKNESSKELLVYGNSIVLPQLEGRIKSVIFKPFVVWNVATQPGTYTITFSVEPA
jgi:hypothetical protein